MVMDYCVIPVPPVSLPACPSTVDAFAPVEFPTKAVPA